MTVNFHGTGLNERSGLARQHRLRIFETADGGGIAGLRCKTRRRRALGERRAGGELVRRQRLSTDARDPPRLPLVSGIETVGDDTCP
jgi:hypothetical protein